MADANSISALWTWFVFGGTLSPQQAKLLLKKWEQEGLTLREALTQLPQNADSLGVPRDAAQRLKPPATLPDVDAIRWDAETYPAGLRDLPLKLRPALLFYEGNAALLARPLIYLYPGALSETPEEDGASEDGASEDGASEEDDAAGNGAREATSLLLGDYALPAVLRGTPQAELLLNEMATSEGALVLFVPHGIRHLEFDERERALLDAGRLVYVTPFPPQAEHNPAWTPFLQQIALATATRCVFSSPAGLADYAAAPVRPPALLLPGVMPSPRTKPDSVDSVYAADSLDDVLVWLADLAQPPSPAQSEPDTSAALLVVEVEEPPPSPEEILTTLEAGGHIPDVLRERLKSLKD